MAAMAAVVDHFLPPAAVRGMKVLSRDLFSRHVVVPALIMPPKQCSNCVRRFKPILLKQTGVKRLLGASGGGEVRGRIPCPHVSVLPQLSCYLHVCSVVMCVGSNTRYIR